MVNSKPLEVWETELRSQVSEVDLLGEIVLTSEECHELGYLLGQLMHRRGWNAGCNIICEYYLSAFAVYLVAQGKEGYDAGAFWPAVREVTGLELHPLQATEWGQLFETAVEHLGVVSFTGLGGHRYVGPILAHGGIPINNLQEFFEYLLCPSIEDPRYAALTTHDYLEERLERTHVHYKLSEPVLRFLQYGGNIAEDFVERCRQMAFQIASEMSTATESFGLPKAVVAHYYEWLTTRDRLLPQRRGRFRKPRLILEPWGRGLTLQFPPQEIAAQETIETVYWRIYADDTFLSEIPVELRRMEFHWRTTEESFPLSQKAAVYRVELCTAGQDSSIVLCQSWCYPVLQSDLPVLTFDPEMCAFIPILHGTLPAQSLWLLYPHTAELIGEPTDSFSPAEELPPLPWDWDEFKGIYIDLTHIRRLILQLATGDQ
ncbi:MAG: hypothetical protein RBT47_03070, partial [Anaerolineae bacterium]|nr:hypothetical protein [Anaerolineae bacterium]